MIKFFSFFVTSNLFISLNAFCLYLLYAFKEKSNFFLSTPILVFSITYMGYHALRFIPWKKYGQDIGAETVDFYNNFKILFSVSILIALASFIYGVLEFNQNQYIVLISIMVLGLLYERILTSSFSLRGIPYGKPFIIAFTWSLTCAGLVEDITISMFMDCFIFIFLLSIPFDIKDRAQDKKENIKTFATEYFFKTKLISSALFLIYGVYQYLEVREYIFLILIPLYLTLMYLPKKNNLTYYYGFDGIVLIRCLFYFFQN